VMKTVRPANFLQEKKNMFCLHPSHDLHDIQ
jgi:hypothetical protein